MPRMYVGGVNLLLPWYGYVPASLPPTAPSPDQLTRLTAVDPVRATVGDAPTRAEGGGGAFDHVEPVLGLIGLVVGAGLKLHPYTKVAGLIIGVGIAVLNWGSEPAGGEGSSSGGGGGF